MINNRLKKALVVFFLLIACFSYYFYQVFFSANVRDDKGSIAFYIPSGSTFEDVSDRMYNEKIVEDIISFRFVSKLLKYQDGVKAGRFQINGGMTNLELVRMLRSGSQMVVRVTFNNLRFKEELNGVFCQKLECDQKAFYEALNNDSLLVGYGFNAQTIPAMFIPNTYEFYWNNTTKDVLDRMKKEYDLFWTASRLQKAEAIGLTPIEVSILASIVEEEQKKHPVERPRIAGVYMRRLKIGMALQADPTVKFALGDFSIKRVRDLSIDSPYNTYKYPGIPPGPICIPSISSIDAVLNYEEHDYLYFCAKGDGSFEHDFSKSFEEHKRKGMKYRRILRQQSIH